MCYGDESIRQAVSCLEITNKTRFYLHFTFSRINCSLSKASNCSDFSPVTSSCFFLKKRKYFDRAKGRKIQFWSNWGSEIPTHTHELPFVSASYGKIFATLVVGDSTYENPLCRCCFFCILQQFRVALSGTPCQDQPCKRGGGREAFTEKNISHKIPAFFVSISRSFLCGNKRGGGAVLVGVSLVFSLPPIESSIDNKNRFVGASK